MPNTSLVSRDAKADVNSQQGPHMLQGPNSKIAFGLSKCYLVGVRMLSCQRGTLWNPENSNQKFNRRCR